MNARIRLLGLALCLFGTAQAVTNTWESSSPATPFASGQGNRVIDTLAVSADGQTVYAGTGSGSVFRYIYSDTTPAAFIFTDQTNVARSTLTVSNAITVTGINDPASINIGNGEYRIGSGSWTDTPGTVSINDTVIVRHTSSASYSTKVDTTLTIGGVSDIFSTTTLSIPTYAVTASAGTGGSASCNPPSVTSGSSSICTAAANPGYRFTGWSGDCSSAGDNATCNLSSIVAAKTSMANFAQNTYAVTASAGTGGSASCSPASVTYGGSSTCTAVPSAGYTFSAWSGDCSSAGNNATCNLSSIVATTVSVASFMANSTATLTANPPSPALAGQGTTLTVQVSGVAGTPTGSVVFKDASSALGTVALNGSGGATYSGNFAIGPHTLSASYAGNVTYRPSVGYLSYQVASTIDTTISVKTTPNLSQPGQSVPVSVSVTPLSNVGSLSGTVDVSSDGQSCRITLPAVSCPLVFARKGVKKLTVAYSGNSFYSAGTGSGTHFVGKRTRLTPILMLLLD